LGIALEHGQALGVTRWVVAALVVLSVVPGVVALERVRSGLGTDANRRLMQAAPVVVAVAALVNMFAREREPVRVLGFDLLCLVALTVTVVRIQKTAPESLLTDEWAERHFWKSTLVVLPGLVLFMVAFAIL
jgi:hypothetical protein